MRITSRCALPRALRAVWALATAASLFFFTAAVGAQEDPGRAAALDPSLRLARVDLGAGVDRTAALRLGTLVEDYHSFAVVAATPDALERQDASLSWQPLPTEISLRAVRRDPLRQPMPEGSEGAGEYLIVQFVAPARDAWLDQLSRDGVEFLQYVPHQAFLVHASEKGRAAIAGHPKVRWSGPFSSAYKVDPALIDGGPGITPPERTTDGRNVYDVAVFKRATGAGLRAALEAAGARVRNEIVLPANYFDLYRVEAAFASVAAFAAIPGVITIDPWVRPMAEDERASHICAGNYTNPTTISGPGYDPTTQFGVNGANVTVSVVDDGVGIPGDGGYYVTAANTVNGPLRGASAGAQGHGHLNASIIAGTTPYSTLDPTGHNYGAGIAPGSHVINIPLLRAGYTGVEADCYADTVATNGPNGVPGSISNNSWGNGTNANVYDAYTAQFDGFVRDASTAAGLQPITLVFSAGNSGPGALSLTRPKAAKNLIATGNGENLRTELYGTSANNMDDLNNSSSRGPAADGRVKPDITAPGTAIAGGRSGPDALFGNIDTYHRWSSGTSHAAPHVAGAAALLTQLWKAGHGGQNPSPAMLKAILVSGTVDMNGVNTAAARPNGNEGWGRLNLKNVLNTGATVGYVDQAQVLTTVGQTFAYSGTLADGARPLVVALVWTDPPGAGGANPALVNNLDLEVTVGATLYRGNVFSGGVSTTGGTADTLNNVENVFLPAGTSAGTPVNVTIRATALNGDGALGTGDTTDQHFALVVFNATPPVPVELSGFSIE